MQAQPVNGVAVKDEPKVATRLLLVTKYPSQYITEHIAPKLEMLGFEKVVVVPPNHRGAIRDVDVVAFMFQMCSHRECNSFKDRAKNEGVPFVLLTRQAAEWPLTFRKAGIRLRASSTAASLITLPPVPKWQPKLTTPTTAPTAPTFGQWLNEQRAQAGLTFREVAKLCDVTKGKVERWVYRGNAIEQRHLDCLIHLFGELPDDIMPRIADAAAVFAAQESTALTALYRAATTLGIPGPIVVKVDAATTVSVGSRDWTAQTPEAAIAKASAALRRRLSDAMAKMRAAQEALGE